MTLREKCAQLVLFEFRFDDPDYDAAMRRAKDIGFGGVVVRGGSLFELGPFVNTLQKNAKQPLLVAAAYDRGAGREVRGATVFPPHLAVAAAASEELARSKGRLTAREAKAMGVRWLLGAEPEAFAGNASLARAYADGAAEMKVHAGPIDGVIVAPPDPEEAVLDLQEVDEAELDRRVEGLLALKKKLGLYGERLTNQAGAEKVVGAPSHQEAAEKLAEAAIVRIRDGPVVCFGDPRSGPVPDVVAWGDDDASRRAAARALAGEIPFAGRLPFELPGA
jgi:beta-glucosidase-like glycosyl hydrolase